MTIIEEINLLIRYAVSEKDVEMAKALVEKYRLNRVALSVLKEFYSSLPEAREEPVSRIVHIDRRHGLYLLGVGTVAHDYLFFATEDEAGNLGEFQEESGDEEVFGFFGYLSKESFLKLHPRMSEFKELGTTLKINKALCPVCSAAVGENHQLGCPVEVCPWCFGQLSYCNCRFDQLDKEEISGDEDIRSITSGCFEATLKNCLFARSRGVNTSLVVLKILSSEVSVDSDINHMPVVKFFAHLDIEREF